jgi:hypothetical protein
MSKGTISGAVTTQIVLGGGVYGQFLDITESGTVAVALHSTTAITAPTNVLGAKIVNHGSVLGGNGIYHGYGLTGTKGGDGVALHGGGTLVNSGLVQAGSGGSASPSGQYYGNGGTGGIGAAISFYGDIVNAGSIAGGAGGNGADFGKGGAGGAGISLGRSGTVTNHGEILGGSGGSVGAYGFGGSGAVGVIIAGEGIVNNTGTIEGGQGGSGGYGLYDYPGGEGAPGAAGLVIGRYGDVTNTGTISGGQGGVSILYTGYRIGIEGGDGIDLKNGGVIANAGLIQGGASGPGYPESDSTGIFLGGNALVTNKGTIASGAPQYPIPSGGTLFSGDALDFATTGTLINTGNISNPGGGGAAILFTGAGDISNAGVIDGGAGLAIDLSAGGTLVNKGQIYGNTGGVQIAGGTLEALAGTISGAVPGSTQTAADAIEFGSLSGTLVIAPHAAFNGNIAANPNAFDTLILDNGGPGTLNGFGTTVTGFSALDTTAKSNWTVNGTVSGVASASLGAGASLTFGGPASIGTLAFAGSGGGTVALVEPGNVTTVFAGLSTGDSIFLEGISASSFSYQNGTLTLLGPGNTPLDTLDFNNFLTPADFALKHPFGATEVTYAGPADADWSRITHWH